MTRAWIALLLLIASPAFAQTGTTLITCTGPTEYVEDNSVIRSMITYKFYRGASREGPFNLETRWGNAVDVCQTRFSNLAPGTHWFVVTATAYGVESLPSDPVPWPPLTPKRPTDVQARP